ncbi:SDR family oxidoreductase [Microbacterium lacus]|uniref:SDR family oxidoreductase n=1 Tax=Microbacterium lacus TaxID=415217 RepID=UPI00384E7F78
MRIAVAGGTGVVGRHIMNVARDRGHEAIPLTRSNGIDLVTGSGLPEWLDGVDSVIDVSNRSTLKTDESVAFFTAVTHNLLAAERKAGVHHHVALSIVGADAAPDGYYAGKLAQEGLVEAADVPWTIQRSTQFHEFAAMMFDQAKAGPVHLAPRARTQPIAAREVAEHMVAVAVAAPTGRAVDLAGPQEESLVEMVRAYARAKGHRGWIPAVSLPGSMGRAQRSGALLPHSDAHRGRQTFTEWLASLA